MTSRGYAHVTLFPHEPIQRITLLKFGLYAGWIVTHEGGEEWCTYAEYDFNFWLNFNKLPAEDLRKSADEELIIK
ncbi:hypothetical protein Rhal01_02221 [Rubritalea halochordaticola]|uniref:Uncharacterized protein n=1 Tax=Rubritalea halochordaticola TaxID=714537 RepID=A0ABP9V231_9BACT